jgi:hypothetical protein
MLVLGHNLVIADNTQWIFKSLGVSVSPGIFAGSYEHGNVPSGSKKGGTLLDLLSDYQLLWS